MAETQTLTADELKRYRRLGLNRLEQLLIQLPEVVTEADYFVDTAIRTLSNLPARTKDAPPYEALYGTGHPLDRYRDVATDRLEDLVIDFDQLAAIDSDIDRYIRKLSDLPERPAGRIPYVGLFMLPPEGGNSVVTAAGAYTGKQYVTTDQLLKIAATQRYKSNLEALTPGVNETCDRYQINTPLRIAHFLAQVMHESGGFRWLREIWGPTATQRRYEGRTDLGNTQPGDGERFMGRGLIQLTGRSNYQQFSKNLGVDFVGNPQLVEQPPYAVVVAGWYWDSRSLNQWADRDDLRQVTRRINGGYNGLADREKYLKRAKLVLQ
ncbi:MAG: glycoside hydrolase family 19 protein [Cyanobacteria bacterium P01_D01_bin.128]